MWRMATGLDNACLDIYCALSISLFISVILSDKNAKTGEASKKKSKFCRFELNLKFNNKKNWQRASGAQKKWKSIGWCSSFLLIEDKGWTIVQNLKKVFFGKKWQSNALVTLAVLTDIECVNLAYTKCITDNHYMACWFGFL